LGPLVRVPPSSFVSELSSSCPSSSLSGSLPSSSSSDENIVTSLSVLSSYTWKISASSTLLREAQDGDAIISTSTEPPGRDHYSNLNPRDPFDVYAWIMFIHLSTCLLSDFIKSGNRELLFRSHNAIDLQRGQQECVRAFRPAGDI